MKVARCLSLCVAAATAAGVPGDQVRRLRSPPLELLAQSQLGAHPPVEGQRVGAHGTHGHPHGNHSHGGKHGSHGHDGGGHAGGGDGTLQRWGRGQPHSGPSKAPAALKLARVSAAPARQRATMRARQALLANRSNASANDQAVLANQSGASSSGTLSSDEKQIMHGFCANSPDLCSNPEAAGWNCMEQCQRLMEKCAVRRGPDDDEKCESEVAGMAGMSWGKFMDKNAHRHDASVNATALEIEAEQQEEREERTATPQRMQRNVTRDPHPRAAATDV